MGNVKNRGVPIEVDIEDEICVQVLNEGYLKTFQMFCRLNVEIVAVTNYIPSTEKFNFIWIRDVGNRVRNGLKSSIFGTHVSIIRKSKGTRKLSLGKNSTSLQLAKTIKSMQMQGVLIISHSPITKTDLYSIYF